MSDELAGAQLTVREGKDGWLFLDHFESLNVMSFYQDESVVTDRVLSAWARTMGRRHRWFAERKIPLVTIIVPETCSIYPDMLPDDIHLAPTSPFERLQSKLEPEVAKEVVYPRQVLVNGRSRFETYQKVDSHWTDWGAYLGYRALMERVRRLVPHARIIKTEEIIWEQRRTFGALGPLMTPEQSCYVPIPKIAGASSRTLENLATERRDAILTVESGNPNLPTALIFRDSFATGMASFLQQSFSRTIYATGHAIHYDLVERLKPDVVIYERAERALYSCPEEPSPSDSRALFGDLRLGSDTAMAAQRNSRTLLTAGKGADALAMSEKAVDLAAPDAPGLGRAYVHRAKVYGLLGNVQAGLECLRHAATLEPDAALPVMAIADIKRSQGDLLQAVALFRKAAALEPTVPHYWDALASALLEQKDSAGAREAAERSLAIDDARLQPYLLMTNILSLEGDLEGARLKALQAMEIDPDSRYVLSSVASVLLQQAQWVSARDVLQRSLRLYPDDPGLEPYLALCEARIQEQTKSEKPEVEAAEPSASTQD